MSCWASSRIERSARVPDVEDLAVGLPSLVLEDLHQAVDPVLDVGEAAPLRPAVHELDRLAVEDVVEELRQDPARPFLRGVDVVEVRPEPVEGAEERELQPLRVPVRPDDAVEELLEARVDPALLVDRAVDERRGVLVELGVRAHPVDLGGGREDDALAVLHRHLDDPEVLLEVELEDGERLLDVRRRRRDGDEREDDVALLDVVLDPLAVDRDVALEEAEALLGEELRDPVAPDVEAEDLPVGRRAGCAA